MSDPSPCIDESTILEFVQGALAPAGARMVEAHLARCAECRAVVSELARSSLVAPAVSDGQGPSPAAGAFAQATPAATSAATTQRLYHAQPSPDPAAMRTVATEPPVMPEAPTELAPAIDARAVPMPGQVLAGKYLVERVIGHGGMGVVVSAKHVHLGQRVALKFLNAEACKTQEAVARFLREARAAVQIQGEHVARVTDVGMLESGAPYMVMELLRGADLGQIVKTRGPLTVHEAVEYVLQACEAIAEAHVLGIVHRDLKPQNLFLTQRPDGSPLVKVLDFGISKTPIGGSLFEGNLTSGEVMMGSPKYMSPEQMRSTRDVDARTDVWALGVVLYELLAGAPPFQADTMAGLAAAIQTMPPTALRFVRADVPVELERVIFRCLEKHRDARMPSVAALAEALRPFAPPHASVSVERVVRMMKGAQLDVRVPLVPPGAPPPGAVTAEGLAGTNPGETRSSPASLVWGIAVVLALVGGAGTFLYLFGRGAHPTSAAGVDSGQRAADGASATTTAATTLAGTATATATATETAMATAATAATATTATATPTATAAATATLVANRRTMPKPTATATTPATAAPASLPSSTSDVSRNGLLDRK
jgi:serine/threonine-protein kinase